MKDKQVVGAIGVCLQQGKVTWQNQNQNSKNEPKSCAHHERSGKSSHIVTQSCATRDHCHQRSRAVRVALEVDLKRISGGRLHIVARIPARVFDADLVGR